MALSYDDLMAEAAKKAKANGLNFKAKGGTMVLIRPILLLAKAEQKVVLALVESVQSDDLSLEAKTDAVDAILIAAADKKDALKKSLADLPLEMRVRIFQEWMEAADLPEASPSTS